MSIRVQTKYILRENSTSQVSKMNNPPALYSQREARTTTTTTEMYLSRNWEMGPQQQFLILDYINNDKPSRMIQSIRDKPISFQSYYIVAFPLCCRGGLWLRRHFSTWHPTTHICNFMLSLLIINKQRPTIAHLSLSLTPPQRLLIYPLQNVFFKQKRNPFRFSFHQVLTQSQLTSMLLRARSHPFNQRKLCKLCNSHEMAQKKRLPKPP